MGLGKCLNQLFKLKLTANSKSRLEDSPSLKNYLHDIFEQCYQDAKEIVSDQSQLPLKSFPEAPIAPLEQVLDENWLP